MNRYLILNPDPFLTPEPPPPEQLQQRDHFGASSPATARLALFSKTAMMNAAFADCNLSSTQRIENVDI
jgi:hypothetical protein